MTSPRASVTEADVRRIRGLARQGMNARAIAQSLWEAGGPCLATETVRRIVRRDTWAWLDETVPTKAEAPDTGGSLARLAKELQESADEVSLADALVKEMKGEMP
jgi:hypothetical protein